jgi:VanZ family protein
VTARRLLTQGPFAAVVLLSIIVLFTPGSATPTLYPGLDKLAHLSLFAALALTGRRAGLPAAGLAGGLVAYAVGSEVLQGVLPIGRDAEVLDALTDAVGVALGMLAARVVEVRRVGRA